MYFRRSDCVVLVRVDYVHAVKPFPSTIRVDAERSEAPNLIARKKDNIILSRCSIREIISLYIIFYQGWHKLNVIGKVHLIIFALGQVTFIDR